jgi:hypothetical protein
MVTELWNCMPNSQVLKDLASIYYAVIAPQVLMSMVVLYIFWLPRTEGSSLLELFLFLSVQIFLFSSFCLNQINIHHFNSPYF